MSTILDDLMILQVNSADVLESYNKTVTIFSNNLCERWKWKLTAIVACNIYTVSQKTSTFNFVNNSVKN